MYSTNPFNLNDSLFTADYWLEKATDPERLIAPEAAIVSFNQEIIRRQPRFMKDLTNYPKLIPKAKLTTMLKAKITELNPGYYHNHRQLTPNYLNTVKNNLNLNNIPDFSVPKYGVTIFRTDLRTFPTNDSVYCTPTDCSFDLWQETAINPTEPVIVLHSSSDSEWYFIQTYNYSGWVVKCNIALLNCYNDWLQYVNEPNILVVTGKQLHIPLPTNGHELIFEMGARLFPAIKDHRRSNSALIKLPIKKENNTVEEVILTINSPQNVHFGYLPYNLTNLLRQAFKMLDQPYGWGGQDAKIDCSAFISNIFATFGFRLPRNANQQAQSAGITIPFTNLNPQERRQLIARLSPGALLYLKGHVMLFLGEDQGSFYVIHALSSYGLKNGNKVEPVPLFRVTITDLDLLRPDGKSLLESLTVAKVLTL
ncbi:MAG TPA: SH3 domain-containing protein [Bacillota bacterium]|jgi:hypothetical protein|nr:SH3 domain-containing protein [Bacillota bacterium]HOL09155.1 SH3 domain-containing protein [Bacillota bacterium]HPO96830.1 SH3 domain-containing protein [Bacillota bacterium]